MNLQYDSYQIRQKILKILGAELHIFDPSGNVALFTKLKAFKLKEDIRIYTGEDMTDEVLSIQARNIIDFSATYDVYDSKSKEKIGALGRKGLKSLLKDEWVVLDKDDNQIGVIKEDSTIVALIRRFVISFIPQKFHCLIQGKEVTTYQQNFNPFVRKIKVDFSQNKDNALDKRVGIAAGILLCVIEGKQG